MAMSNAKRALIVGASRGLGLGLTEELVGRGWSVVATARNPRQATDLRQLADAKPDAVTVETVDLDSFVTIDALAERLENETFDLVFVNAGVYGPHHQSVDQATSDEIGALMMTNAVAPIRLARKFVSLVRSDTGIIGFMTSRMGSVADNTSGGMDLYRASKAALNSLTRGFVANDIGERKLTVLSLHPGWVKTEMGGDTAPLDVATSVKGLADVIEKREGSKEHAFVDYQGQVLPW